MSFRKRLWWQWVPETSRGPFKFLLRHGYGLDDRQKIQRAVLSGEIKPTTSALSLQNYITLCRLVGVRLKYREERVCPHCDKTFWRHRKIRIYKPELAQPAQPETTTTEG